MDRRSLLQSIFAVIPFFGAKFTFAAEEPKQLYEQELASIKKELDTWVGKKFGDLVNAYGNPQDFVLPRVRDAIAKKHGIDIEKYCIHFAIPLAGNYIWPIPDPDVIKSFGPVELFQQAPQTCLIYGRKGSWMKIS